MAKMETLGYQINEACMALIDGDWRRAFVHNRKDSTLYNLMFPDERNMETGENKFRDVPLKKMARASIYVCNRCGEWVDPARVLSIGTLDGDKTGKPINLVIELHCIHNYMPWTMQRVPWNDVPGVSAIGGIHAT